jgi:hypothetical protein
MKKIEFLKQKSENQKWKLRMATLIKCYPGSGKVGVQYFLNKHQEFYERNNIDSPSHCFILGALVPKRYPKFYKVEDKFFDEIDFSKDEFRGLENKLFEFF